MKEEKRKKELEGEEILKDAIGVVMYYRNGNLGNKGNVSAMLSLDSDECQLSDEQLWGIMKDGMSFARFSALNIILQRIVVLDMNLEQLDLIMHIFEESQKSISDLDEAEIFNNLPLDTLMSAVKTLIGERIYKKFKKTKLERMFHNHSTRFFSNHAGFAMRIIHQGKFQEALDNCSSFAQVIALMDYMIKGTIEEKILAETLMCSYPEEVKKEAEDIKSKIRC